MSDYLDLLGEAPRHPKSAQCPTCGRWSRVERVVADGSPLSSEEGHLLTVVCAQHGRGLA